MAIIIQVQSKIFSSIWEHIFRKYYLEVFDLERFNVKGKHKLIVILLPFLLLFLMTFFFCCLLKSNNKRIELTIKLLQLTWCKFWIYICVYLLGYLICSTIFGKHIFLFMILQFQFLSLNCWIPAVE